MEIYAYSLRTGSIKQIIDYTNGNSLFTDKHALKAVELSNSFKENYAFLWCVRIFEAIK